MILKGYLLLLIICCDGNCFGFTPITAKQLLMFTFFSLIMISFLLFYYNRIPKSNVSKEKLETPIYQSKDILLQSNVIDANFIIAEKTTSTLVKVIIYILIALVSVTPLFQLLGID